MIFFLVCVLNVTILIIVRVVTACRQIRALETIHATIRVRFFKTRVNGILVQVVHLRRRIIIVRAAVREIDQTRFVVVHVIIEVRRFTTGHHSFREYVFILQQT